MPLVTDFTDPEAFSLHSPVEQLHLVLQSSWMNFYPAGGAKKKAALVVQEAIWTRAGVTSGSS